MPIKIKDAEGNEHEILTPKEQTDMVTGAVGNHVKREMKPLTETLAGITKAISELPNVSELIDTKLEEFQPAAPNPDDKAKDHKIEDDPAYRALLKRQEESDKALKTLAEERDAERKKGRDGTLRTLAAEALTKGGFNDPSRQAMAVKLLISDGKIKYSSDKSDEILFDDLPLADGVDDWKKSDEAKVFLPPTGAGGSGDRSLGGGGNRSQGGDDLPGALERVLTGELR